MTRLPGKAIQVVTIGVGLYVLDADGGIWWLGRSGEWESVEVPRDQAVRLRRNKLARERRRKLPRLKVRP
jgi:hypothetical protein